MAEIVVNGGYVKVGCLDVMASNYDPTATESCVNCCSYKKEIIGCRDPLANNYDSNATVDCVDCCSYESVDTIPLNSIISFVSKNSVASPSCQGPYTIDTERVVTNLTNVECCNTLSIGITPPQDYDYYWDGTKCLQHKICPTDFTCVDCDSFNWWNNTYMANHNGNSLQTVSQLLWTQLVDTVSNSGQTFYVQTSNGELLDSICCTKVNGTFINGVCSCQTPPIDVNTPRCISNLTEFLDFISNDDGYDFFTTNFLTIGASLGLTNEQINFIITNINSNYDVNSNSIPDKTEARLILSNALNVTGGFYLSFNSITNIPTQVIQSVCNDIGGYWDDTSSQCMCNSLVNQCEIDITEVTTQNIKDFYNNPIQIVIKDGQPITQECCNRLIKDYNLPWSWQNPYCYATPKEDCLPVTFTLNDKPMDVPPCETDLELSMWVYVGKPNSPCQPIPDPPSNDVIIIDGEVCDITISPNTGSLLTQKSTGTANKDVGPIESIISPIVTTPCCYNNLNPILAKISITNPILSPYLVQVKEYNSNLDFFDRWVEIKATLPSSGLTHNFSVNLEIYQGLNCCCSYDIFVDDIRVNCARQESVLIVNDIQCPGFELNRVIDNKKSWVYNPGTSDVGISEYDEIEREDGSYGTLNGEGIINRTFAPSLDADIPWRYTDYFEQSSVLEKHSNLVLNSKEFGLTFDMCADCPISGSSLGCIDGYTLSANTNVCYNISGDTTSAITVTTVTYLSLLNLESYKKTFQSFWIPFMEQFIPATTIWVAGERWCNEPCTIIDPCDYDFELTDADISIEPVPPGVYSGPVRGGGIKYEVATTLESTLRLTNPIADAPTSSPNILLINDLGLTNTNTIILTQEQYNIDIQSYRDKFSPRTTEII